MTEAEIIPDDVMQAALDAAMAAQITPGEGVVTISEYLRFTAADADELGVFLGSKYADDSPRFHVLDLIRGDEYDDTVRAILRPVIAAVAAAIRAKGAH